MVTVEELVAKSSIYEVLARYCRGIDRMDRALAGSCWHPDGTADYGELYAGTGDGFLDWVWPLHRDTFVAHSHQITNVLIEVDGDHAVSEAYVTVALRTTAGVGSGGDLVSRGRYLDRWSRRDGVWAIDHRRHVVDLDSAQPPGPSPHATRARRGPDDPSYELFRRRS